MWIQAVLCCLFLNLETHALDNGVARTPPMGWMSWERFRCNTDCVNDPDNCISAKLLMEMADRMAGDGYLAAGYEYLAVDDCWMAKQRNSTDGRLMADPERFPNGMKPVVDYIHSKGLKFGLYGDIGVLTCKGYPGNEYYIPLDAETYASWGVDMLKLDCCYAGNPVQGYEAMGFFLNRTGRPIMYACSLPTCMGSSLDYNLVAKYCNMWRNAPDVTDDWDNVYNIITFYGRNDKHFAEVAGPGQWNDPDQLIVGDFSLSYGQQRAQMGMWAMFAAPLFMSVDLRNIDPESKKILLNKGVLAIDQDPLGVAGRRVWNETNYLDPVEGWLRPLSPEGKGRYAVGIFNSGSNGRLIIVNKTMTELGLTDQRGYTLTEVFTEKTYGPYKLQDKLFAKLLGRSMFLAIAEPISNQ